MTGAIEKLLEELEQTGYRTENGALLSNDRGWHDLRRVLKNHPAWPGAPVEKFDPAANILAISILRFKARYLNQMLASDPPFEMRPQIRRELAAVDNELISRGLAP